MPAWPSAVETPLNSSIAGAPRATRGGQSGICSLRPIIRRTRSCRAEPAIGRLGAGVAPVAQHRDLVADLLHLLELVADEQQAGALVAQLAQQPEQHLASCGVSDAVGSSSSSTRERSDSALAISTSCTSATLSCETGVRGSMIEFEHRRASGAPRRERRRSRSAASRPPPSRSSRMFSPTEKRGIRLRS